MMPPGGKAVPGRGYMEEWEKHLHGRAGAKKTGGGENGSSLGGLGPPKVGPPISGGPKGGGGGRVATLTRVS